jgi:hypothetical protein
MQIRHGLCGLPGNRTRTVQYVAITTPIDSYLPRHKHHIQTRLDQSYVLKLPKCSSSMRFNYYVNSEKIKVSLSLSPLSFRPTASVSVSESRNPNVRVVKPIATKTCKLTVYFHCSLQHHEYIGIENANERRPGIINIRRCLTAATQQPQHCQLLPRSG